MFFRAITLISLCFWYPLFADFKFDEYLVKNTEDYIKELAEEISPITAEEYVKAKKRLANFFNDKEKKWVKEQWVKGLSTAKAVLTYPHREPDALIDIAIFAYHHQQNATRKNYKIENMIKGAACLSYMDPKSNNLQRAKALLLYLTQTEWQCTPQTLEELNQLYPIEKLRTEDKRFQEILKFKYVNHSIEESPQGAILHLNFSQSLSSLEPENYLEISPNVDGFMHVEGKSISISGFQAGIEYKIKLRPGIKSVLNEKINVATEVGFFVKDLKPVISFPRNTYIYPKQEKICLPVRAINIDKARATLYRIPDRGIVNNLWELMERSYHLDTAEKLFSTEIDFNGKAKPNQTITKNLDATKILPELKPGIYVLEVRQKGVLQHYDAQVADQWFIVTDIGLTTFTSEQTLAVHARAFSSAKPLKGIQLELISADNDILGTVTTDGDGFAEFAKELLTGKAGKRPVAIFAKNDSLGFSFLSLTSAGFDFSDRGVKGRTICNDYDAMIFCERGIYRPDEKVNMAAILRNGHGKEVPANPLTVIIRSPRGTEIKREVLKGNDLGTYHMEYKLPADCPMGMWSAEAFVDPTKGPVGATSFRVDDFSPNKMELSLTALNKTAKLGTTQTCTLNAHYLYGAPVHDRQAILEAKIAPNPTPFETWKDFHFGLDDDKFVSQVVTGSTSLITDGKVELNVDIPNDLSCSQALQVDLGARLADVASSQTAATSVALLTQPYIVGIHEKETGNSENLEIEIIATDCNGKLVASADLEYTFFKSEAQYQWYKDNRYGNWSYQRVYQDKPINKGVVTTKADAPVLLSFKGEAAIPHAIEIRQKDGTKLARFRIGKQYNTVKDRPDNLVIIPTTKVVKLGEQAILKVNAPFEGEALIIAGLNSVQLKDTVHLKQGVNVLKIPTNEAWGSGAYVMVSLVRALDKKVTSIQAKRAVGIHWIQVDPKDHILEIKLDLPEQIKPQNQLKVPVSIENLNNQEARLMLAIVDEGVIGLTNFKTPDPIEYFFGQRALGLEMRDAYGYIIDPVDADVIDMRSGGDCLMLRRGAFVPRINDKVLSFFDGDIHLDAYGKAEVVMDIPVFFGKLRVYAVAIAKNKMGSQTGMVVVKDNLIVDPNLPSFLTVGDENNFNIRLENTTDKPIECEVSVSLEKAFKPNSRKQTIKLAPKEQKRFSVTAFAKQIGEGVVHIEAKGEGINYQYSTTVEVRAAYQPVLVSNSHEIKPKENVNLALQDTLKGLHAADAQADLFITNQGPWNLGKIQKWLINYPFGCNQQIISKGFAAIFAFKQCKDDALDPNRVEYQRICYEVIEHLNEHQSSTGGWGIWPRENDDLNLTAYALEMLIFAQDSGLTVPKIMIEKVLRSGKEKINSADWQIKQGREKADNIAGLFKLCSQTKEIDTATTRYCFDEYFEKCESAVAKSLFIAAVATIQDLTRVQKGIKELNLLITKGIAVDEAAAIVAHLTPFKEIEIIKQTIQSMIEALHKGMDSDITRLNTQTLAMILKANFGDKLPTTKEIKVSINKTMFNEKNHLAQAIKPLQDLAIQNHGSDSVWLFINAYGIASEPAPVHERGIAVTRAFYKVDGTKIDPENMNLGERVVVVLTGKISNSVHESYLMLSEWLPAGFTHTNTIANYRWLKDAQDNATVQKRHDRYIASWRQPAKVEEFKIAYEVIATHTGKFQQPGIHIENMINPAQYATYTPTTVVVKETVGTKEKKSL